MQLVPGTRLGAYEIVGLLGAGGMGEVYRAVDTRLDRHVALKILPEAVASDPERTARFQREAKVLASLNHPHIAALFGLEQDGGRHFLTMELVEGETLADRIARGPVPVDETLAIARQIAEALEAAHEQGIIHRDLKPANIKVRPDGTVKVLDYGLAKAITTDSNLTTSATLGNSPTVTSPAGVTGVGFLLGTAAYMSPEQAKGKAADKRSDLWALGCVLYELLTGKRAFDGDDVSDTLAAVLRAEPTWTALPDGVPPAVQMLLRRCLVKDPRVRLGGASGAVFALSDGVALPASYERPPALSPRRPWHLTLISASLAVLIASAVAAVSAWRLARQRPASAVVRFTVPLPSDQTLSFAGRQLIALSPDGGQFAYATSRGLFLRVLSEFQSRQLTTASTGAGQQSPAFSPDGRSLAFWGAGALQRMPVSGGAATTICPAANPAGVTWDPTGLVFAVPDRGIFRCPANGGDPEQLATIGSHEQASTPQLLSNRRLLFTVAKRDDGAARWVKADVVLQSLDSGDRRTIINGATDARVIGTGHVLYAVGGVVFAAPFDVDRGEISGPAVPVIEGVQRPTALATGVVHYATSNNGSLLYIPGPTQPFVNQSELAVADREGRVTRLKTPPASYVHVRTSRDGRRLALGVDDGAGADMYIYDLAGPTAMTRVPTSGRNRMPIWSPDGERLAFQSDREGDLAVFTQRVDATGVVERLTKPANGETHVPESWSPDGRHLLFSIQKGDLYELWVVSIAEKKSSPFGKATSREPIGAVFSPDGRWVAYGSNRLPEGAGIFGVSADSGVFLQPFPATGPVYQAPKQERDFHPLWAANSGELFFIPTAASGRIVAMPIATKPIPTFGNPQQLPARVTRNRLSGEPRAFDVLPDGRFVGLVAVGAESDGSAPASGEVRIVLNWTEELKRLVATK